MRKLIHYVQSETRDFAILTNSQAMFIFTWCGKPLGFGIFHRFPFNLNQLANKYGHHILNSVQVHVIDMVSLHFGQKNTSQLSFIQVSFWDSGPYPKDSAQ